jgi:hypothetical protein
MRKPPGDKIQAPICFLCACSYPRGSALTNNPIERRRPKLHTDLFFFADEKTTQALFSSDSYLEKYGKDPLGHFDLSRCPHEFEDWWIDVPFGDTCMRVLCCPEDRVCNRPGCLTMHELCSECQVSVCSSCWQHVGRDKPELPPASLADDMMIFYALPEMYEDGGLTVMEMVCASTCLTAVICFSMEVKYGNMFDSQLHMQRHRVEARGNATTFLLPWENILAELRRLEGNAENLPVVPDLPRSGAQLAYVVQV